MRNAASVLTLIQLQQSSIADSASNSEWVSATTTLTVTSVASAVDTAAVL